jgi:hypothetical protein
MPTPPRPSGPSGSGSGSDRIRLFGAAFGATLLFGGLLLFVLVKLTGPGSGISATTDSTTSTTANGQALVPGSSITVGSTPPSVVDKTLTGPLTLPLALADLHLDSSSATSTADDAGPSSSQYCNRTPKTDGLTDWTGESLAEPVGFPLVFQQLARFDTPAHASAYVASYVGTVNCDQWVIPASGSTPDITLRPKVTKPTTTYGDDTRGVEFQGTSSFITIYGRVALIRKSTDVYLVSITSLKQDDLADVDRLLQVAVPRLGY